MSPSRSSTSQKRIVTQAKPTAILMDDGHGWPPNLVRLLHDLGYAVACLFNFELLPVVVLTQAVQVVLIDLHHLRPADLPALKQVRQNAPLTAVVLVSPTRSEPLIAQAFDWGATALLVWPAAVETFRAALEPPSSQ